MGRLQIPRANAKVCGALGAAVAFAVAATQGTAVADALTRPAAPAPAAPAPAGTASAGSASAGSAVCAAADVSLGNPGFELPGTTATFSYHPAANAASPTPGIAWETDNPAHIVELWKNGYKGVPAQSGTYFAELNSTAVASLYQVLPTVPGATMHWRLAHRGRSGTDVMRVFIGAAGGTPAAQTPTGAAGPDISDGTTAWGRYAGVYHVPAGQTSTRFSFDAVSSAGGASVGNFLDSVVFTVAATACDDSATAGSDTPSTIDVVANDRGDALTVSAPSGARFGATTVVGNAVRYTPQAGFFGADDFSYVVTDSFGVTSTATVSVTVAPPVGFPAALTSTGVGPATQSVTTSVPAGGSAALLVTGAAVGSLTVAGEGDYHVDATSGVLTFSPVLGFTGPATAVTYQITSPGGASRSATYTATVTTPAGPTATPLTSTGVGTVTQTRSVTVPPSGAICLLDAGQHPVTSLTIGGQGRYVLDATTGVIGFTPQLGFTGAAHPATYRITDAYGSTATATYLPSVTPPADPTALPLVSDGVGVTAQSATVAAPEAGAVSLVGTDGATTDAIVVAGQGRYVLDPTDGVIVFTPQLGFTGAATAATYRIVDAYGDASTSTYTPTVHAPPAPSAVPLTSIGVASATQRAAVTIPAAGAVTLLDAASRPTVAHLVARQGEYRLDAGTGTITFTPVAGFTGSANPVTYRIADAYGSTATATYTPTVTGSAGSRPTARPLTSTGVGTSPQAATIAVPKSGTSTLLDAHGEPTDRVPVSGQGEYRLDRGTGTITFTPVAGFSGTAAPVGYRVTDAHGGSATSRYTATVTAPPAEPKADPRTTTGRPAVPQSTIVPVPAAGTVWLVDAAGAITDLVAVAGQGSYALDRASGTITFTPDAGFAGTAAAVTYRVTDAYGRSSEAAYTARVGNAVLAQTGRDVAATFTAGLLCLPAGVLLIVLARPRRRALGRHAETR